MTDTHVLAWLRLARLPSIGPILAKRLLDSFGSPEAILNAHPATLAAVEGIGTHRANQIVTHAPATEKPAQEELAKARDNGVAIIPQDDPRYPPALKTITDPPVLLYVRGELLPGDAVAIGIVGARQCTLYGREQAARFGHDLAAAGFTVISGGARGIDSGAHLGALRRQGRTIVVQGCGLLHTYPPENKDLYARIVAEKAGAVISELPLDAPPLKENFPPRNRIIAGMSLGVLVVEANLRSGSLITARLAAADYGREVFAIPGRVDSSASAGTHHLIKSGSAHLVESVDDILDHLGDVGAALRGINGEARGDETRSHEDTKDHEEKAENENGSLFGKCEDRAQGDGAGDGSESFTSVQQRILKALGANASATNGLTIDDLLVATALPTSVLMAELTMLQIRNAIARLPANRFARLP